MKKLFLSSIFLLSSFLINAQNAFTAVELSVKSGHGQAVANLVESFMKDAKFKKGSGYALQRMWQGSDERSHRLLWWGPLGNRGRADGDVKDYENSAFWSSLRAHLDGSGKAYSGRILDWKQGNDEQDNWLVYDVIVKDPASYAKAHQAIIKKLSNSEFKNRTVALGTYDVGRPGGATHWIGLTGTDTDDLLLMHKNFQEKHTKEVTEYFQNRGEVIEIKDVRITDILNFN